MRHRSNRTVAVACLLILSAPAHRHLAGQTTTSIAELEAQARANNVDALFALAVLHETGQSVPKDPARAAVLYHRAAELGDVAAKTQLGLLYQSGTGVPKDARQAHRLFTEAAEADDAEGMFRLAVAYCYGVGTARDATLARRWFTRAANRGHQEAQLMLGLMVHEGVGGVRNDFAARRWLREARDGPDRGVASRAGKVFAQLDARLRYAGMQPHEWKEALLAISVGLLLAAGMSDADVTQHQRAQDPSNPYNYDMFSTTRRKQHCTFVSTSFMTLHGTRAFAGGPGTIRQCVSY